MTRPPPDPASEDGPGRRLVARSGPRVGALVAVERATVLPPDGRPWFVEAVEGSRDCDGRVEWG